MQALASNERLFHCSVFRVQKQRSQNQIEAWRSGLDLKRRCGEMSELWLKAEARDMEQASTISAFSSVGRATDS